MSESEVCRVMNTHSKEGAVLVDVQVLGRPSVVYTKLPLMADFSGLVSIPTVNERVVVTEPDSGPKYVEGILTAAGEETPSMESEEFALQFDPSTRLFFEKDGNGGYDLSIETSGNITIEGDGDTTLDAAGDIYIGDSGSATKVARQDHTHDYDDTGDTSDGTAGTTTKTTSTPKETGTSTNIE